MVWQDFIIKIKEEDITKIISIDESGFNKLIQKSKGLSKTQKKKTKQDHKKEKEEILNKKFPTFNIKIVN
jgi:hypothetical protein